MTSTVYVKTYSKDLPWFKWCLASISRFWAEDSRILINCEPGDVATVRAMASEVAADRNVEITEWVQWGNNKEYIFQQWCKLTADQVTDSEVIAFFDSDLVINRAIGISDFMDQEKRRLSWYIEPYASVTSSEPSAVKWLNTTWRAFNIKPDYEFMRRHPFILWRETIEGCRRYLESQHGPLHDYMLNLPGPGTGVEFSEFNCLGFYAWLFQADRYWFQDVTTPEVKAKLGNNPVDQHHSWSGDPAQAEARFRQACEAVDYHLARAQLEHAYAETLPLGQEERGTPHPWPTPPVEPVSEPESGGRLGSSILEQGTTDECPDSGSTPGPVDYEKNVSAAHASEPRSPGEEISEIHPAPESVDRPTANTEETLVQKSDLSHMVHNDAVADPAFAGADRSVTREMEWPSSTDGQHEAARGAPENVVRSQEVSP